MKRAIIAGATIAVAIATAGGGFVAVRGHLHSTGASDVALVAPAAAQASREPIYYQDPDGRPFYSLTPRKTQDGRDYRAVPAGADLSFDDEPVVAPAPATTADRKIKYYRNPMGLADTSPVPKKDPMGMDYIPVYEGEDTDDGAVKLSPGKIQRTGVKSEPAARAGYPDHDPGSRHDPARRAPHIGHFDARRKLGAKGRRRHDGRPRQEGPAPDANLQPRGIVGGRRIRLDHYVQDDRR